MATITVRSGTDREGHYRYTALEEEVSVMEAAVCECLAEWRHSDDDTVTFCDWAYTHPAPTVRRALATERCSGGLIRVEACDKNFVGWCHICRRYRPTSPQPGYDQWRPVRSPPHLRCGPAMRRHRLSWRRRLAWLKPWFACSVGRP